MPVRKPRDLTASLGPNARLLGLDVSAKTIGMALSDVGRSIATPYDMVRRTKLIPDLAKIKALVEKEGVGGFVVGLPINMDGSEGPRCQSVRQFARDLLAVIDLPLAFWDERLSTFAAEDAMIAADVSRARRAQMVDKVAAAVILQGCLDMIGGEQKPPGA